jgi:hypothetical protein
MHPVQREQSERQVKVGVCYPGFGWLHGPQVQNPMEAKMCRQRSMKVSLELRALEYMANCLKVFEWNGPNLVLGCIDGKKRLN